MPSNKLGYCAAGSEVIPPRIGPMMVPMFAHIGRIRKARDWYLRLVSLCHQPGLPVLYSLLLPYNFRNHGSHNTHISIQCTAQHPEDQGLPKGLRKTES